MATNTRAPAIQHPGAAARQPAAADAVPQYSLGKMLAIWAVTGLPMALLAWVVTPAVIPYSSLHPGIIYWLLMIAGMAWQFVVAVAILYGELGTLRWSAVAPRIWAQTPRDPRTDRPNRRLYWWVLPAVLFNTVVAFGLATYLDAPMGWLFPALQAAAYDINELASREFQGQWWLLGVAVVGCIFNYFLGEALLWHGVLLPKMQGVFGKGDWVANAVLFGVYHLHKPTQLPSIIVTNMAYSWPARRFRSVWMAVIVHGVEGIPVLVVPLLVILGLVGN
jgi:uncharacterized protein